VDGRLRVNVQLIDAATDQHLWAERYDRTLDDAFAIQSDLAQKIVTAVGAALSTKEQGTLAAAPTPSVEAYRLYLQGRAFSLRPGASRDDIETGQLFYQQAIALDPDFALAHAALSRAHGEMWWLRYDPASSRLDRQREEAEIALRLTPDLPEAHMAMGRWHYTSRRDWRAALAEYAVALRARPNDVEALELAGFTHRRLGNWDEAIAAFRTAAALDPRNANLFWDLGASTFEITRRYADAVDAYDQASRLAPDLRSLPVDRGGTIIRWKGDVGPLREALVRLSADADLGVRGSVAIQRARLLLLERNADGLLRELERTRLAVLAEVSFFVPSDLFAAWAHRLRGDEASARSAFEAAVARLDSALRELPDDRRVHASRGLALAGLGRRGEALAQAQWLADTRWYRADAYVGPEVAQDRAMILAQAGVADEALDEIDRLLSGPSWLSVHLLRLDPRWDPIREHPRFKALLKKYGS